MAHSLVVKTMYAIIQLIYSLFFIQSCLCSCDSGVTGCVSGRTRARLVRCSRRFSAGGCVEPVDRVWMFDAQRQNCTERLGCPSKKNMNRFKSYLRCMTMCQPLIDMYSLILMNRVYSENYLRTQRPEHLIETDQVLEEAYKEYEEAPKVNVPAEPILDPEIIALRHIMPPDIDYTLNY